jgi:hypothetical protein
VTTLVFKQIKPQRLQLEAMRAALLRGATVVANGIEDDYKKTVKTWKKKPNFEKIIDLGPPITILVGTDNEIYKYADEGTKGPYPIFAGIFTGKSSKKALAFSSQFTPKTIPGVIGSSAGAIGAVDTFRPFVEHPGIKARNFSKEIEKKWQKRFKREMEKAMSNVRKASGHAI